MWFTQKIWKLEELSLVRTIGFTADKTLDFCLKGAGQELVLHTNSKEFSANKHERSDVLCGFSAL